MTTVPARTNVPAKDATERKEELRRGCWKERGWRGKERSVLENDATSSRRTMNWLPSMAFEEPGVRVRRGESRNQESGLE